MSEPSNVSKVNAVSTVDVGDVRRRCQEAFEAAGVAFAPHTHEPVLDYEIAQTIRARFGLTGTETKSLLLRTKGGRYVMFVSVEGERVDKQRARDALEEKFSVASETELVQETGCVPGCGVPIGLPPHVTVLLDPKTSSAKSLIFSPGPPTETIEVTAADWNALLGVIKNSVVPY